MVSCSVPDCITTGRNNPGKHSFHRFPKDPNVRQKWLRAMNRQSWTPHKNSVVCGKHFAINRFRGVINKIVKTGSIPTLFLPVSMLTRIPSLIIKVSFSSYEVHKIIN
ncbi:THAP domain-containing protein 2-like [Cydia strobilella]|uniref:THAP domain-containing protein 2-like n=1 Tax=Cydia strobilella TaxID=1100964 RepID=UPI003007BA19